MAVADASKIRRCPSLMDSSVVAMVRELFDDDMLDAVVLFMGGNAKFATKTKSEFDAVVDEFEIGSSRRIHTLKFTIKGGGNLEFRRQIKSEVLVSGSRPTILFEPSTFECEFEIGEWPPESQVVNRVVRAIDEVTYGNDAAQSVTLPNEFLSAIGTQVQALASATSGSFDDVRRLRTDLEKELSERRIEQDRIATERELALQKATESAQFELQKEREALTARIAEVDNSENKHARRELRAKITDDIQARLLKPIVAKDVAGHRTSLFVIGLVALALPTVVVAHALYEITIGASSDATTTIFTAVRLGGASAAFLIIVFYLMGFLKKIAEEDARSQRQVERYSLDIDRASWIIETVLEVQSRENSTVPREWLEGVTTDMFGGGNSASKDDKTALEAFGEILQTGVELELNGSGGALKVNPKSAKRLGKSGTTDL